MYIYKIEIINLLQFYTHVFTIREINLTYKLNLTVNQRELPSDWRQSVKPLVVEHGTGSPEVSTISVTRVNNNRVSRVLDRSTGTLEFRDHPRDAPKLLEFEFSGPLGDPGSIPVRTNVFDVPVHAGRNGPSGGNGLFNPLSTEYSRSK